GDAAFFLCASATGKMLKPFIVFARKPGCRRASQLNSSPLVACRWSTQSKKRKNL
ncbi:hypothetical protein L914_21651, partial [Phytophthora nicotianae]